MQDKPIVILVHGFNVKDPKLTVGKLTAPFIDAGFDVYPFNYGYTNLHTVTLRNIPLAKKLARIIRENYKGRRVILVGHSNGCTIIKLASDKYGLKANTAIFINPALKRDENPAKSIRHVHVFHNEEDKVVTLGKWLRRFTWFARIARPWGEMGRYGYLGDDLNVLNYCTQHDYTPSALDHSGVFEKRCVNEFADVFIGLARGVD